MNRISQRSNIRSVSVREDVEIVKAYTESTPSIETTSNPKMANIGALWECVANGNPAYDDTHENPITISLESVVETEGKYHRDNTRVSAVGSRA